MDTLFYVVNPYVIYVHAVSFPVLDEVMELCDNLVTRVIFLSADLWWDDHFFFVSRDLQKSSQVSRFYFNCLIKDGFSINTVEVLGVRISRANFLPFDILGFRFIQSAVPSFSVLDRSFFPSRENWPKKFPNKKKDEKWCFAVADPDLQIRGRGGGGGWDGHPDHEKRREPGSPKTIFRPLGP